MLHSRCTQSSHSQFLLKSLSAGCLQSILAMFYNFPARITIAHKKPKAQQIFSQADMEGAFEAFLGVCMKYCAMDQLLEWFTKLLEPWIKGNLDMAIHLQNERSKHRMLRAQELGKPKKLNKSVHREDRRRADPDLVGASPHVVYPTLGVSLRYRKLQISTR